MYQGDFFSYSWSIDKKETERTVIRIYGLNEKNESTCLIVNDFTPYMYIQLIPDDIEWNDSKVGLIMRKIESIVKERGPIVYQLMFKKKLYFADLDKKGNRKHYPFIFCNFNNQEDIKYLCNRITKPQNIPGLGYITLKPHENNASPVLQLTSFRKIPTAGWITFRGKKVEQDDKSTYCTHEYVVSWKKLDPKNINTIVRPIIMGYDLEAYSSIPSSMPKAERPEDKIFQISCVFARQGSNPDSYEKFLLSLGKPDKEALGKDITCIPCDTEHDLLVAFAEIIRERQPNIIIGYNIFTFDIPYMIDRAKYAHCFGEFSKQGMDIIGRSEERNIKWSSSAYKNQSYQFLEVEGRIFVDLLPMVKRDYKMNNYKLETIARYFLKDIGKDPLDVKGIFKCYKLGMAAVKNEKLINEINSDPNIDKKNPIYNKKINDLEYGIKKGSNALAICGKYCVKDSYIVVRLFDKLTSWIALCEMSKLTNVPIVSLLTQGQQLKVFSQIYKKCTHENTVVERNGYITKKDDFYTGATVFPPVPGVYDMVVPFDFCLAGDTLISHPAGYSKRIENMIKDEIILGLDGDSFGNFSSINGLQEKGVRDTVKIWLEDGTTITATPEHKFMLENGDWCKAEELKDKYVRCGPEFTEDVIGDDESKWSLIVDDFVFDMKENRENTLAFMRMLGYILTDGCIYMSTKNTRKCAEVYMGTMIDAENFVADLCKLSTIVPTIRKRESKMKGTTYCINIPQKVTNMIHSLDGIIVGKRATQAMKLPTFLLRDDCPLAVIREFLGGLYGGDGVAPCLCASTNRFGNIRFKLTTIEKYLPEMIQFFETLKLLLNKFNIISSIDTPIKIKYSENSIKPKDFKENPRSDVQISIYWYDSYKFLEKIGFRYCINKSYKLSLAASYTKMCDKIRQQNLSVNLEIEKSRKINNRIKLNDSLNNAHIIVFDKEPPLKEISLSSDKDYKNYKNNPTRKLRVQQSYKVVDFLEGTNTLEWFEKKSYAVSRDDKTIPYFRKKVIDVKPDIPQAVFDIEVNKVHNFLANGAATSNCSLYPSTIIAYNISYDTLVTDDSIPDEKCHVMSFSDHINCAHDPKEIRKNELTEIIKKYDSEMNEYRKKRDSTKNKEIKNEMKMKLESIKDQMKPYREERSNIQKSKAKNTICAERHFRWLKEPRGVLPEILINLLEARKNTKREMNVAKSKIKEFKEGTDEWFEATTYHDILDQRQLALKVSANSAYGCLGVREGYLPFMPGAMCTTYKGRIAIEQAAKAITTNWGGVLVYGDSVPDYTPVIVKYPNSTINVETIGSLGREWIDYDQFKCDEFDRIQKEQAAVNLEVWTNGKWSKIKRVIRHKTQKDIYRVCSHRGLVDVTQDHSLLRENGEILKPKEISESDSLLHSFPESFEEFDTTIIEGYIVDGKDSKEINYLDEEDGWIFGHLFASSVLVEGNMLVYSISSRLKNYLNKLNINYIENEYALLLTNKESVKRFEHLLFDKNKNKIVPYTILNASKKIKKSFYQGYNSNKITNLDQPEQVGSQGLYLIAKSINQIDLGYTNKIKYIKKLDIYPEYVYDLETEDGIFQAGVGEIVVKNTDSNYVNFPECKSVQEVWDHSIKVAEEVSKLYPKPMSLAYEEKVYYRFFILTKKRYMSLECERNGQFKTDGNGKKAISKKGVLLQRRDNSNYIRKVYGDMIMKIFDRVDRDIILDFLIDEINKLCCHFYSSADFIITKSVGECEIEFDEEGNVALSEAIDKKGKPSKKIGDYAIKELPRDERKREEKMAKKDATTELEYYSRCLPAQAQLARKMRERGQMVSAGSRIEYLITTNGGHTANQYEKIEDYQYFVKHASILQIDFLYYLKQLSNPVDQVLDIMYLNDTKYKYQFKTDFLLQQYKLRVNKSKVMEQIKNLTKPKINFV